MMKPALVFRTLVIAGSLCQPFAQAKPSNNPIASKPSTPYRGSDKSAPPSSTINPTKPSPAKVLVGRCVSVRDGDTLVLLSGDAFTTIHLYAIEAPEKTQPFGIQAKESLWEMAFGQTLAIYPVPSQQESADALCAWVFAGKMGLNAEQLRRGLVWWDRLGASRESKMTVLESKARSSRTGLWRDKAPLSPWQWRFRNEKEKAVLPLNTR